MPAPIFLLFAGYKYAHKLYFIPHDSAPWLRLEKFQHLPKGHEMHHYDSLKLSHEWVIFMRNDSHCSWLPFWRCSAVFPKGLGKHFFCLLDCIQKVFPSCKQLYVTNHFPWYFIDVMRGKQGRRGNRKSVNLYQCFICSLTNIQLHGAKVTKQPRENIWTQLNLNDLVLVTVKRRYRA